MKTSSLLNIVIIMGFSWVLVGASHAREVDYLQERNGVFYEVNEDKGFTGELVQYWSSGHKKFGGYFKNGKRYGLRTEWYEHGQKATEWNYKDGEMHGLRTDWYKNGQKEYEWNYKNGKRDGLVTGWYENGQKTGVESFKDGKLVEKLCCD